MLLETLVAEVAGFLAAVLAERPLALRAFDQTAAAGTVLAAGTGARASGTVRIVAVFAVDVAGSTEGHAAVITVVAFVGPRRAATILARHAFPVVQFDVGAAAAVVVQDLRHETEEVQQPPFGQCGGNGPDAFSFAEALATDVRMGDFVVVGRRIGIECHDAIGRMLAQVPPVEDDLESPEPHVVQYDPVGSDAQDVLFDVDPCLVELVVERQQVAVDVGNRGDSWRCLAGFEPLDDPSQFALVVCQHLCEIGVQVFGRPSPAAAMSQFDLPHEPLGFVPVVVREVDRAARRAGRGDMLVDEHRRAQSALVDGGHGNLQNRGGR